VRRVRISAIELKAGVLAIRRRLGYVDDLSGLNRPVRTVSQRPEVVVPVKGLISATKGDHAGTRPRAPVAVTQSSRLLAAKQRAARR
jgi:hypothetical protein